MTRILLNPPDLAQTASSLRDAAGEYQAIGAYVGYCDCSCMPPDVAAVVESATMQARSELNALSGYLSVEASNLAARAEISHDGAAPAYSAPGLGGTQSSISIGPLVGAGAAAAPGFLTIPSGYGAAAAVPSGAISIGGGGMAPQPSYSASISIGGGMTPQASSSSASISIGGGVTVQPSYSASISIGSGMPSQPSYAASLPIVSSGSNDNTVSPGISIPLGSAGDLPGDALIRYGWSLGPGASSSLDHRLFPHTLGPSADEITSLFYNHAAGPANRFSGPSR